MSDNDFDYQAYTRENPPNPARINRGKEARERRRAAAVIRPAVRVEQEILAQFQELAAPGQSAEQAINQALREWLAAKELKGMIRAELQDAVHQAFVQVRLDFPQLKPERSLALEEG